MIKVIFTHKQNFSAVCDTKQVVFFIFANLQTKRGLDTMLRVLSDLCLHYAIL